MPYLSGARGKIGGHDSVGGWRNSLAVEKQRGRRRRFQSRLELGRSPTKSLTWAAWRAVTWARPGDPAFEGGSRVPNSAVKSKPKGRGQQDRGRTPEPSTDLFFFLSFIFLLSYAEPYRFPCISHSLSPLLSTRCFSPLQSGTSNDNDASPKVCSQIAFPGAAASRVG